MCCFCSWLASLFSSCARQAPPPPQGNITGYGFAWTPNTQFANFQVVTLRDTDAGGLYIAFEQPNIDSPRWFFEDNNNNAGIGIIFPLQAASNAFAQAVQALTNDANLQQRLEGFLRYTHTCLNYIYATQAGQQLINNIRQSNNRVYIKPSNGGNQIQGGGAKLCFVANKIVNSNLNLTNQERAQLMQELAQASNQNQPQAQFQWLAQRVNQMPLYTLYEQANALTQTFLQTNHAVTWQELQDWFANGPNSQFIQQLALVQPVAGVNFAKFLKLAVIVALFPNTAAGHGGQSTMYFDVHDWSQNNIQVDRNINTVNDRPPAIGLAHELIHAYYNAIGREPGNEAGDYSTTLAECICVGLPPWDNQNNPITENAIRAAWPPNNLPQNDLLNHRANLPDRTIYFPPPQNETPTSLRTGNLGAI